MRWFGLLLAVAGQPVEVDLDGSTHSASGPRLAFDVDGVLRALTLADPARVLTEAAAFLDALPAGARVISTSISEKGQMLLLIEQADRQQIWQYDQSGRLERRTEIRISTP